MIPCAAGDRRDVPSMRHHLQQTISGSVSKILQKISHLNFNRPSDQLSTRTPPTTVDADVRANASPSPLSKFRRSRSAHMPSLFFSTLFSSLPIAFSKIRNLQDC